MAKLKHSEVRRKGLTGSAPPELETKFVHALFDGNELKFSFLIRSKGGGQTFLCLALGKKDLPVLLEYIASKAPELFDELFKAASIARAGLAEKSKTAAASGKKQPSSRTKAKRHGRRK